MVLPSMSLSGYKLIGVFYCLVSVFSRVGGGGGVMGADWRVSQSISGYDIL